ncbi:MAG: hypothetical protein EHM46_04190, partial [Bacteroidetes bacterium]
MKPQNFLFGLLLPVFLSSCTSVKRFGYAVYHGEDNSLAGIELFESDLSTPEPGIPGKTLWDLSASAQTQLIQILHERYTDNGRFFSALNNTYLSEDVRPVPVYTEKDLQMVFTIRKHRDYGSIHGSSLSGRYSPADRIEYLKFSLSLPEECRLRFRSWNRFSTEYGQLDIADISFSRTIEIGTSAEPGERSSFSAGRSVNREEEQSIRSRYMILNGSINDYRIEIEEEGTREIDLCGNVIASVKLAFPEFPVLVAVPVFSPSAAGETGEIPYGISVPVRLDLSMMTVPGIALLPDTIRALLEMEYVYRHVVRGWDTYQEWDDRVRYFRGKVTREVILFTRQEVLPTFHCIGSNRPGRADVKIMAPSGTV